MKGSSLAKIAFLFAIRQTRPVETSFLCLKNLILIILCLQELSGTGQIRADRFNINWNWQQYVSVDRHTSMMISFDNKQTCEADYARGFKGGNVYLGSTLAKGKWGNSLELVNDASIAHFRAGININSYHGTLEMWLKSNTQNNIWTDGKEHWILSMQRETTNGIRTLGLFKRSYDNALVFFEASNLDGNPERSLVYNPGALQADNWHHILISWDRTKGRLWLTVNGTGVTGTINEDFSPDPFYILWLGSSGSDRQSFSPLGGYIDNIRVSDLNVEELNQTDKHVHIAVDMQILTTAESTLRKWFSFMEQTQMNGGWANCYTYPTLLPSATGARQLIRPDGYVVNDKGHIGQAACWLIYAAEVMQEPWYIHLAEKMADAYLSAQYKEGCWAPGYWAKPSGIVPERNFEKIKLQDQNQVHPMYILLYLYRLTNKKLYLEGALKTGEFLLHAQNPNGSWSHSYDLKKQIGLTARGNPQGGEINDNASDDGMTAMLMMYHFTKEEKYLDAYIRCADWFLEAQAGPPTWGWAFQYDADNNPIWARLQEPPSISIPGSYIATSALRQAFWVTGNSKYLEAPKKFFQWMIKASEKREYSFWYDVKTGRPIVSTPETPGKIYFIDNPDELADFMKVSTKIDYAKMHKRNPEDMLAQIEKDLISGIPPEYAPGPNLEYIANIMNTMVENICKNRDEQNMMGGWVSRGQGERSAAGDVIWIKQNRVLDMLKWVENARMLIGELPPVFRGEGDLEVCAYPFSDWYETPLRKTKN